MGQIKAFKKKMDCSHPEQEVEGPFLFCVICGMQLGEVRARTEEYQCTDFEMSTHNRRAYFQKALAAKLGSELDPDTERRLADLVAKLKESGTPLVTQKDVRRAVTTKFGKNISPEYVFYSAILHRNSKIPRGSSRVSIAGLYDGRGQIWSAPTLR